MPRKHNFTLREQQFIKDNAQMGGNWLADALQADRAVIYQYATDEGFSVKKGGKVHPSDRRIKRMTTGKCAWPKNYRKYKKELVLRDGLRCHYCDYMMTFEEAQIDHILAKARGGTDAPHNLVLACARCNNLKSTLCYTCPEFREAIA
jgi:5-methylcytosine-specific restriction endonuclease McrA